MQGLMSSAPRGRAAAGNRPASRSRAREEIRRLAPAESPPTTRGAASPDSCSSQDSTRCTSSLWGARVSVAGLGARAF
jgi:hypothetical protein